MLSRNSNESRKIYKLEYCIKYMANDLDSIVEKHNGSWADVIKDIGISVVDSEKRMDMYTDVMDEVAKDSSTIKILCREMKYTMLEIREYTDKLKEVSITDTLTGLYNRNFFDIIIDKTIARVKRHKEKTSLIMIDIDHFKRVNDNYGHPAGDGVLREMGSILRKRARKLDSPCRYGGEEFAIILPATEKNDALSLSYKLNNIINSSSIKYGGEKNSPITISLGVDQAMKKDSVKSLIGRVDGFLYEAKRSGRNCVVGRDGIYVPKD